MKINPTHPAPVAGDIEYPRFLPAGDSAVIVEFGATIDLRINHKVMALDRAVDVARLAGVEETVPSYRSLVVQFDARMTCFSRLTKQLRRLMDATADGQTQNMRNWCLPVAYGDGCGEDLAEVAERCGMSEAGIVERHLAGEYNVFMIGFAPGFAYLGGLDAALHLPRRQDPRPRIAAGSVIIGGMQAAVAATPIPCGWHILGRTPAVLFDLTRLDPFVLRPGDGVRFEAVSAAAFESLAARAADGEMIARRV